MHPASQHFKPFTCSMHSRGVGGTPQEVQTYFCLPLAEQNKECLNLLRCTTNTSGSVYNCSFLLASTFCLQQGHSIGVCALQDLAILKCLHSHVCTLSTCAYLCIHHLHIFALQQGGKLQLEQSPAACKRAASGCGWGAGRGASLRMPSCT